MPTQRIEIIINPARARRGAAAVGRSLDGVQNRADRLRTVLARTFALVGVSAALVQITRFSDSFISLTNRSRIAADSIGGELVGTIDALAAVAARTRVPVLALAGVYQRGSIAADQLNASQEELIRLSEIAGKAVAIQGGSIQEARGALTQLSQSLGQNIVRGEEFNSILEGAFPIALAAARGIERTAGSIGLLRTEIIEGRVSSEEFFRGILAGGAEIDRQFALTTPTIGQAFTVVNTGLVRASESLSTIAAPLAGFIRDIGLAITAMAGVEQQQLVTPEQSDRIEFITNSIEGLRIVAFATAVVLAGRFAASMGTATLSMLAATRQAGAAGAALSGLRGGLALLGGPTGLAFLAAFAVYEFVSSVRAAREELQEAQPPIDQFATSLRELTEAQVQSRQFAFDDRLRDTRTEATRVAGEIERINTLLANPAQGIAAAHSNRQNLQRDLVDLTAEYDQLQTNIGAAEVQQSALNDALARARFVGPRQQEPEAEVARREEPVDETRVKRSLTNLLRLYESSNDQIAEISLSRIDQVTRNEELGVARAIELGRERGVAAEDVERTITAIRIAGALERQDIGQQQADRDRELEQERIERVSNRNAESVDAIRSQLVSLQPSYDQAVIAALQWADQTIAGLDRQDAAFEQNAATVRGVLDARIRLAQDARDAEAQADTAQDVRARQERALEHARALSQVFDAQVAVGLASRDARLEAELWALRLRQAIDVTAEGASEALESIDAVIERQRQLASDNPLAGLQVGFETFTAQLPSVAEQINMAVSSSFSQAEDALVRFVTTGKLNFSDLVDSILADLARIAIRQAILGPLSQALGGALGGVFGGSFGGGSAPAGGPVTSGPSPFAISLARGGLVNGPGGPTSDSISARLSHGEFVVNAAATRRYLPQLLGINKMQTGGQVQAPPNIQIQVVPPAGSRVEDARVRRRRGPNGDEQIQVVLVEAVDGAVRSGDLDGAFGEHFNLNPTLNAR